MDMYKEEMNVLGADLYSGLQKIFPDEKDLTERLEAARGPLLSWYRGNKRDLPWRENQDAYRIWISEIMLQQTRVEAVKPYFARFMECFPTVQALAECEEEELFKYWEGLGYYSRARNLKKAAKIIVSQYGGRKCHAGPFESCRKLRRYLKTSGKEEDRSCGRRGLKDTQKG